MAVSVPEEWLSFENGVSIGKRGSEGGIIVQDQEYPDCARITLERRARWRGIFARSWRFAITCGVYGWLVHTRFFSSQEEAEAEFIRMQGGLEKVVSVILSSDPESEQDRESSAMAVRAFVASYP